MIVDQIARQIMPIAAVQLALAWLLRRSPIMLPIPGTTAVAHLERNLATTNVILSDEDYQTIAGLATES